MRLSGAVEQACCIMAILADPKRTTPVTNDALAEKMLVFADVLEENQSEIGNSKANHFNARNWRRIYFSKKNERSYVA